MSRIVEPGSTRVEKPCIKQFIILLLCFLNHHMEHVGGEQDEILSPSLGLTPFDTLKSLGVLMLLGVKNAA